MEALKTLETGSQTQKKIKKALLYLILMGQIIFLGDMDNAAAKDTIKVIIGCKEKLMKVFENDTLLFESKVQIGKNGCGKEKEGDGKTPLGDYEIKWILSRNGICGKGYKTLNNNTWCDERNSGLVIGTGNPPPNKTDPERLWTSGYGKNGVIIQLDYPNKKDKLEGKTGSCIQIHESTNMKKPSLGCIKLSGEQALKLCKIADQDNTTVSIRETIN